MKNEVSYLLYLLQEPIQFVCLAFMALMYAIKIRQLLKFPGPPEKAELKGNRWTGAIQSLGNVLSPWAMESRRTDLFFYAEFAVFHIGVILTIAATLLIPLAPSLMAPPVTKFFMLFMVLAFLVGLRRIRRRVTERRIRSISSPDDYIAIILITVFIGAGFMALWGWLEGRPETGWMWLFFVLTTFFLLYVPFSKVSHYVLYPFGRIMFGQIFGGRGALEISAQAEEQSEQGGRLK